MRGKVAKRIRRVAHERTLEVAWTHNIWPRFVAIKKRLGRRLKRMYTRGEV